MRLYILSAFIQVAVASFSPYMQIILRNKGYSHSLCGVLLALCQLSAIIMPLVMSAISDRAGRTRPFIVLSSVLASVLALPYLLSSDILTVALASFLMNGFFWCINPLADGFISRNLAGDSSRYGTIRAAGTIGYMTALVVFGTIGFPKEDSNNSILKGMLIFIPLVAVVALLMKENKKEERKEEKGKLFSFSWFPKRFYVFMAIVALTRVGQAVVERLLSAYMTENLRLGNKFLFFVALGAVFECICMIFFGKLKKKGKITSTGILFVSAVGLTVRLLLYLVPGILAFTLAQTLHGLSFGALHLAATSYTADNVESSHYDLGMTIYWSMATNLPEMLGSLAGGFVIEKWGYPTLFFSYAFFPLAACILVIAFASLLKGKER